MQIKSQTKKKFKFMVKKKIFKFMVKKNMKVALYFLIFLFEG